MVFSEIRLALLILCILFFAVCGDVESEEYYGKVAFNIESLPSLNRDTTIFMEHVRYNDGVYRYRQEHYAVAGYRQVSNLKSLLDSFVCASLIDSLEEYDAYSFYFYKKTDYISKRNFSGDRRWFNRFFNSQVYLLHGHGFQRGAFMGAASYLNGHPNSVYETLPCFELGKGTKLNH